MDSDRSLELRRKAVHIAFGFCAFALRWLTWQEAAAVAVAAFLFNRFALPLAGGHTITRGERGYDRGILFYPLAVLALVLVFRHRLEIAGSVWGILAFGDGFATVAGRVAGGARLPWNRQKSWAGLFAFILAGGVASYSLYEFIPHLPVALPVAAIVALTVAVTALVESLPLGLDDNLTVPLAGGAAMAILATASGWTSPGIGRTEAVWLVVNLLLAAAGYAARSVDLSGFLGGLALGMILIVFGGWQLYLVLLVFFVIGTLMTRLGFAYKAGLGLAQDKGGRRGFSHAFSNVGVAAICAVAGAMHPQTASLFWLAGAASLATAAADTTASEVGQWLGRRAFLPVSLRRVPPGTEGAISFEGTAAGLGAGAVVAAVATGLWLQRGGIGDGEIVFFTILLAAFAGSYLESIAGSWNRRSGGGVPNGALNFFNTAAGAVTAAVLMRM